MELTIIIVSYKVRELLEKNLESVFNSNYKNLKVFVIDNNSEDGTVEMVKKKFSQVKLIANKENFGFARAVNQVLPEVNSPYALLLNPDMKLFPETLEKAISWIENKPQAVVAGGQLLDTEGKVVPSVRRFPQIFDQAMISLKIPHLLPRIIDNYLMKSFNYKQEALVDSVRGSFFLINIPAYQKLTTKKISLDERYFIWFEEVDFCRQVKELGGEVWYFPQAKAIDLVGQSFKKVKKGKTQRYFRDSMLKYFQKWESNWKYQLLKILWWPIKLLKS